MDDTSRPIALTGYTHQITTPCGRGYLTVNRDDDGKVVELFFRIGKNGQCRKMLLNTISKYANALIQSGIKTADEIAADFVDNECEHYGGSPLAAKSCLDAIGRAMLKPIGKDAE